MNKHPSHQWLSSSSVYDAIFRTGIGSTAGFVLGTILAQAGLSSTCLSNRCFADHGLISIDGRYLADRLWLWMRHSFGPLRLLHDLRRTLESCCYDMLLSLQRVPKIEGN